MEYSGTTSISQLPISSQVETKNNVVQEDNIKIDNPIQEEMDKRLMESGTDPTLEQKTYNQLVSGLQQASAAGQTVLPSRDIPQSTTPLIQDEQIQANYLPDAHTEDYIKNDSTTQDMILANKKEEQVLDNLDSLYQEFQLPLLVGILYFLFQLPIIQKYLNKIIPALFKSDGNPNLYGYIFNSIAFGFIYYILLKGIKYFTTI